MAIDLDNPGPIDPNGSQFQPMLSKLQGNILKGHGRDHTVHIFLKLDGGDVAATRKRLGRFASKVVTPALQQHIESQQFKKYQIPGAMFGNLFITARGYRALGFSQAEIDAAFPERPGDFGVQSNFREGMQAHANELSDPPPSKWEQGYREGEIDAMILLADDDAGYLLRQARALINELEDFSEVLIVERGNALRRTDNNEGIEHFGYVDGRSQPIYFNTDLANEGNTDKWNPVDPLNIVLVPDKIVSDPECFGSYFVFRKLEQDVLRFKMKEQELADALGLQDEERERAGAMAVGRFEDGTPLAISQTDGFLPLKENNFKYDIDTDGTRCPFHAHIRKSNPRGDILRQFNISEDVAERPRRITRRGITYGERNRHPDFSQALEDLPTKGVGLLFMCFQSSIANQFAFIQSQWVNEEGFIKGGIGIDPVIGQVPQPGGGVPAPLEQTWPIQFGPQADPANPGARKPPDVKPFSFGGFVTMKGGEFFFAPSIPFLRGLES
jgi:Dyp-type peroxidase family